MRELLNRVKIFFAAGPGGLPAGWLALFAVGLCSYAVTVAVPAAFDPVYTIYPDIPNIYWIKAFVSPGQFQGDPMTAFYLSRLGLSAPESLWVRLTALFMHTDPGTLGLKLLSVLACASAALLVLRAAERSAARQAAGAAALLFTAYFLSMDTFYGIPRVYGVLIFLCFAWAAEAGRFMLLPALVPLCLIFYPAAAVGLAACSALAPFFFYKKFAEEKLAPRYLAALAASAAACLLVLSRSVSLQNAGQALSPGSWFEASKLYQRVSSPVDPGNPLDLVLYLGLNLNEHGGLYVVFTGLLGLLAGLGFLSAPGRPRMMPRSVLLLLAGFGAAFAVLYFLHPVSAARQMTFVFPLALVFLAAEALYRLSEGRPVNRGLAAACAAALVCLHPFLSEMISCRGSRGAYEFMSRLPARAVIAAYPGEPLAQTLPLFSGRRSFMQEQYLNQQTLLLGSGNYEAGRRALLAALYARGPEKAAELRRLYGADYLVLEGRHYSEDFLAMTARLPSPMDKEVSALTSAMPDPAAFYKKAAGLAVFSWTEGGYANYILDLAALDRPAGRK